MKKTMLTAMLGVLGFAAPALADSFVLKADPSGAPMCFDQDGNKAPLASCAPLRHYVKANDPSGAPMCFNQYGAKARLEFCSAPSTLDLLVLANP